MFTSKTARIVGFLGTLGGAAALVGTAATGTGAYFTDSHDGTLTASSGHMAINTSGISSVSFDNLNPGQYVDKTISYHAQNANTTKTDIWLYFPDRAAYQAFTGANGDTIYPSGGLGQYGRFAVTAPAGNFSSYNLANASHDVSGCADANGHGSNGPESGLHANDNGYCGVPRYILVQKNLAPGHDGSFKMTFGLQPTWRAQDAPGRERAVQDRGHPARDPARQRVQPGRPELTRSQSVDSHQAPSPSSWPPPSRWRSGRGCSRCSTRAPRRTP